ncbi:radical SAM protein [Tautonia sociabilis]|uniref:radical SAM protein n=1 Tax=Tautonia sociabilis TaxID=2080755 RepID=UPI001F1E69A6|nr:radical SAM protein [Tautonia sociabilis]
MSAPILPPVAPGRRDHRLKSILGRPSGVLVVHELYRSLQGEGTFAGLPCVFVRLTACHLRCSYCDTPHAFNHGEPIALRALLERILAIAAPGDLIEVTGGEPLLQDEALPLMSGLADAGRVVLLETSGACDIGPVDPRVRIILDLKTPGSGEEQANLWDNLAKLKPTDEVKVVVCDRPDFDWALERIREHRLVERCPVLVSPAHGRVDAAELAAWILESGLPLRLQVQLHKQLWGPDARGV